MPEQISLVSSGYLGIGRSKSRKGCPRNTCYEFPDLERISNLVGTKVSQMILDFVAVV